MNLNIPLTKKKSIKKEKIQKITKVRKKVNEIKININHDGLIKGKTLTKIFKINSLSEIKMILNEVNPDTKLKFLMNYATNEFLLFKTDTHTKSKKQKKEVDISYNNENELSIIESTGIIKSFYNSEKLQWDDCFFKKPKKLKYEMAPTLFEVKDNYLLTENRYANVISLEFLGDISTLKNIINRYNCWISIDCYKVDKEFILNKLDIMKKDSMIEKKFSNFISNKIDSIIYNLNETDIFQCELKLLLYDHNLDELDINSEQLINELQENYYTVYIPQEKLNTRKLFEKCIYPNSRMDIIHSIPNNDLYNLLGGINYV